MNERRLETYRKLRRTERAIWIILIVCVFLLFKYGIDIEYEHINGVTLRVLHTITVIVASVSGIVQYSVIERATELEHKIFDE